MYKLIELLGELLKSLFIPSEERITAITNTVESKFDFIETIKIAVNSMEDIINNVGNSPKLTINVGATKYTEAQNLTVLDLSFYKDYKTYGDLIITGFIYIMFLWRFFISIPNLINSTGGIIYAGDMITDISAYKNFGFGRSSSLTRYQDKGGRIYRK